MLSVCYVTTPSMEVARELSRRLVVGRKAACVNIIPTVTSVYQWEGSLQEESECLMMIKTQTSRVEEIVAEVTRHHPYEVPEVISVPMGPGNAEYLQWVAASTTPS
ncbi:divalent cation tolerance protein [Trypanosoma rangeli]|uniref:Divalent cation tolerance protein n=1 Tax=Trypanosoma rangeli TaxID=5698 RepID=A0A3S5IRN7_TRYRA|nr:divalent cation tolerance protein [Trypanosoma rangeli]RNF07875.1 divalent cation tolerance protein [Trypanosoma rangeli]|eukprot:RNF07875.1 divalent cation tolerance protein [Trypanosoma rangeli]